MPCLPSYLSKILLMLPFERKEIHYVMQELDLHWERIKYGTEEVLHVLRKIKGGILRLRDNEIGNSGE